MKRTSSIAKGKQVLGFEDGLIPVRGGSKKESKKEGLLKSPAKASSTSKMDRDPPPAYSDAPEVLPSQDKQALKAPKSRFSTAPETLPTQFEDAPEVIPSHFDDAPEVVPATILEEREREECEEPPPKIQYSDLPEPIEFLVEKPNVHLLPRDIAFIRTADSDYQLCPAPPATSPKDPKPLPFLPPLFYISVHQSGPQSFSPSPNAIPDVALHSTSEKASSLLSFANFQDITFATSITLLPPPPSPDRPWDNNASSSKPMNNPIYLNNAPAFGNRNQGHRTVKLASTSGIFSEKYSFSHTLPRTSVLENFEWRHSNDSLIKAMKKSGLVKGGSSSGGLKLVRCTTGRTIAVYLGDREDSKKRQEDVRKSAGMFRFLNEGVPEKGLGEDFELLAIMSILCIVERWKRVLAVHSQALGNAI